LQPNGLGQSKFRKGDEYETTKREKTEGRKEKLLNGNPLNEGTQTLKKKRFIKRTLPGSNPNISNEGVRAWNVAGNLGAIQNYTGIRLGEEDIKKHRGEKKRGQKNVGTGGFYSKGTSGPNGALDKKRITKIANASIQRIKTKKMAKGQKKKVSKQDNKSTGIKAKTFSSPGKGIPYRKDLPGEKKALEKRDLIEQKRQEKRKQV